MKELGFVSPLHFAWLEEVPTRGLLQLDHVLLSKKRADLVPTDPSPAIDPLWQTPRAADLSDHAAVWFTINI